MKTPIQIQDNINFMQDLIDKKKNFLSKRELGDLSGAYISAEQSLKEDEAYQRALQWTLTNN